MSDASTGGRTLGERPERRTALRRIARIGAQLAAVFALLFVARFVCMGLLLVRMGQECHLGGIAVDVLAHGIRFPLARSWTPSPRSPHGARRSSGGRGHNSPEGDRVIAEIVREALERPR